MIDICGLLLKILKSSTPGLLESGTTKIRQGGDGNGLAEVSALSRRRRFVNRPAGRPVGPLFVLVVMAVCFGAGPAWGQADDDSLRMIPLAPQLEVPSEIGAVDVEVAALGSDATEVEAGGKSSVLIASDADGTLMLAAANEDGGYLGEGPGAVELGIESTAITLVAVASGRRFGEIDPELAQAIQSHEEFGRLTRLLEALMASDKNYLDRLYSYPQAVTLIKSVAAGVASVGPEPSVEAGPGFKQLPERDVAQALAADDAAAYNSDAGPIAPVLKDDFYCVPGSGFSLGIIPCSPWSDRDPWHWFGEAEGIEALFPNNAEEWVIFSSYNPFIDITTFLINETLSDYLPFPLPEGIIGKYIRFTEEATGTPPFLAVAEDTMSGCQSWDRTCKEDGLHATANPNLVNYAMELYEDGVYRDWFYTPGNSTISDKLLNSGAAYREFWAGPKRTRSVLLSPAIDQVRFQRYRFSLAEGDEEGFDRGAVVSFMNTLHLIISIVNVFTDVSEVRNGMNSADVLNLVEPIVACSVEAVNIVKETYPDLIVDGQLVFNSDPEKEVQDLAVELLANVGSAYLAALQTRACQDLLGSAVKGGVSKAVLEKATSIINGLVGASTRQSAKVGADLALAWVKLGYDVANDLIPVLTAYFRPAGDGVDYHLFWKDNPKEFPYIHMVSKSRPPTAQFTHTQRGGFRVELDASQTVPGDSDDLTFSWRVNDANIGRGERLVHDFGAEGRYRVELVVVDGNGLTGTFSSAVDVIPGTPPEVSSLECTPTRYDTFRMVASFSDEDGDIETVEWRSNVGSLEPDRVTSAGTTQVELRASGSTTWASVIVEDAVGNRGSRVCSVNLEYVPTATLGIDSLSAACGREEPWRACYHRLGMNQGELFEFSVSMPREPTGTWHVAWCAKEDREGLCRGQHDWTTRIDKRFSNEAPLTFPMTPPAGAETFWVVAEVRECNKSLCNWPEDFTEVEFHHIEVSVLKTAGQEVLFSEDFESYEDGSLPDDYVIVFNGQGDAEQRVEAEGGNRHLRTAGQQSWGLHMRQDFAFDLPGVVSVSWRMRLDNDQDNYGGTDPSGARYADLGSFGVKNTDEVSASLSINKYESDGRIVAYCQEGGGSRPEVQLGVWTEFRMEVDFAAGRYSMYKDGVKFCERATGMVDLSGRWNSWGESSGMRFISGGSGASVTLFDDIVIRGGSGSDSGDGDDDGGDDDETGQGVLFSEDFESYAAGSRPPGYEFVMGLTGRGAGEQRVESDGGNQYLRMAGRAGPNNEAVLGKFFDFDVPNVVSVTWRMRVDNDINSYLFRDPDGVRTAVFGAFAIKTEDDPFGAILISKNQSDRKIVAWCPSGSGSRPEVRLGVWSEYRWEIDFAASRYTAYKDGQRFCSAPFPLGNLVSSAGIGFLSGDTVMRFDDIVIRGGSGSGGGGGGGSAGETRVFDGIEFVQIPPGEFQMGSTSSESQSNERPVTQVRISRGFWMGKYEVTQRQWEAVMGSNPSHFTNCGGDCPVEAVSWEDVQEFIGKLNARSGGRPYRLPTEAEWEYAARAGTTEDRYGDLDEIAWYRSNSGRTPHLVGQKAANAWGLHDMLGNVWEWVQDWYGSYPGGSVTDPTGPGSGSARVRRGGGWNGSARSCRSADRGGSSPGFRFTTLGFRLLREE